MRKGIGPQEMTPTKLPSFKRPPVVETVLGVQFEHPALQNAHLGAFWKTLGGQWGLVTDAPTLPPTFERFGESPQWGSLGGSLTLTQDPSARLQIRNEADDRMVQIQNGRLHYNWLGRAGGPYPRYGTIRPEFDEILGLFRQFLVDEELGELRANQWEVTYVNHLPRGTVWNDAKDWQNVLVGLPGVWQEPGLVQLESFAGEWHFTIPPQQGRLHIQVAHAKKGPEPTDEILRLTLTARGPVAERSESGLTVDQGLNLGREVIVTAFRDVTSESARKYWGEHDDDC